MRPAAPCARGVHGVQEQFPLRSRHSNGHHRGPPTLDLAYCGHKRSAGRDLAVIYSDSPGRWKKISGTTQFGESLRMKRTASASSRVEIISSAATCSLMKSLIGVSTHAGASATDLTPCLPSSSFMASVKAIRPAFVAEYTLNHARPFLAEIEATLTTSALRCSAPARLSRSTVSR